MVNRQLFFNTYKNIVCLQKPFIVGYIVHIIVKFKKKSNILPNK